MRVEFLVPGEPVPKGRPRVLRSGRTYTPARTTEYADRVNEASAAAFPDGPILGPIKLTCCFVMPTRRRADVDNLLKNLMDGAIGTVYVDDSQVNEAKVMRTYNKNMGCTTVVVEWGENP